MQRALRGPGALGYGLRLRTGQGTWQRAVAMASAALCLWCASGFDWPGRAERLLRALEVAKTVREKREALRLLGDVDAPFDQAPVERALRDSDPDVRSDALDLLTRADPAPALRAALEDAAPGVRARAVETLATYPGPAARAVLLRALGDAESSVRRASARALGSWGEGARNAALALDAERSDRELVEPLARALDDPAIEVRSEAARALGRQGGEDAVAALLRHADDPLPELRAAAVAALAGHVDGRVAVALERALDDTDELVVQAALGAFLGARARAPAARLNTLASSHTPAIADAARRLLARQQSPEAGRSISLPGASARFDAPAPSAPRWLGLLARTAEELSAIEAATIVTALETTLPAREALAADPLLEWLPRAPAVLRPRIARLVERTRAPIAGARLRAGLADRDPELRAACARLFAQADRGERPALRALLADPQGNVRAAAVFALAHTLARDDVRALVEALDDARDEARIAILRALAGGLARCAQTLEHAERAALEDALEPDVAAADQERASWAASALAYVDSEAARKALRRAAAREVRGLRIAALRAGVRDISPAARALRQHLVEHPDPRVAATAVAAQALAGDPLPWRWLYAQVDRARWPIGPAAAFAIASGARTGNSAPVETRARTRERDAEGDPCALLTTREPATRANLIVAVAAAPALACLDAWGPGWLHRSTSWVVRRAAARWATARLQGQPELHATLATCAMRERDPQVQTLCAQALASASAPSVPVSSRASVPAPAAFPVADTLLAASHGAPPASRAPAPPGPRALVLDDGRVLISWPDGGGNVSWPYLTPIADVSAWLSEYARE